jgi:hypothetical protein
MLHTKRMIKKHVSSNFKKLTAKRIRKINKLKGGANLTVTDPSTLQSALSSGQQGDAGSPVVQQGAAGSPALSSPAGSPVVQQGAAGSPTLASSSFLSRKRPQTLFPRNKRPAKPQTGTSSSAKSHDTSEKIKQLKGAMSKFANITGALSKHIESLNQTIK